MKNKILLIGKGGEYFVAQKNKDSTKLEPSSEKIFAREVAPYGFDFNFGCYHSHLGICGYGHGIYQDKGKNGRYPEKEEYPAINLEIIINALESEVEKKEADYILVDQLGYCDMGTYWDISGRAQVLVKR